MQLAGFQALTSDEGARLLAALPRYDEQAAISLATRLRRTHDPELVAAALTQARLRARGRAKFGADAEHMFFTPEGLEQATRASVAAHRAERFTARGADPVLDLCCGIGGDLLALARAGIRVTGVERDPLTCAVAEANVRALRLADRAQVVRADATDVDRSAGTATFCDPARRTEAGRVFDPAAYAPPWSFVLELLTGEAGGAGVKVAPGIPHALVPAGVEAEWVSDAGAVKEAVLWSGALSSGPSRRATLLPSGATLTADTADAEDSIDAPAVGPVGRFLHEPDGAVVRAHLVAAFARLVDGRLVDPDIAYVSTDTPASSPFSTRYEVLDVMPFGLKRLRRYLAERQVGVVTVKKRGSAVEPEQLRRQLRLSGPGSATLVLTRVAGAPTVLVVDPR